jgi:bifunctional non-homologous end joining protein LigD
MPSESNRNPIFVVQEHHASHLHYDFRLEADGVLKSWAVPKEPTLDPEIRRLAVQVEDHPLEYAEFSGDIPEGEYGAGHVDIWDSGTYENLMEAKDPPQSIVQGIEEGHLEFMMHGSKLNGAFALIRMKGQGGKNWLLIKMKDEQARPGSDGDGRHSSRRSADSGRSRAGTVVRSGRPPESIEFTNTDKIMFPSAGITKGEVLEFYDRIADHLLPYLKDRPMTLERLPDGLGDDAPHFWQKDTPEYYPEWISRVRLASERGDPVEYVLVDDRETLLYLVNQGTITFHPWLSRLDDLDRPDFVLFDLDPGPRTFADAVTVARELHDVLKEEKLESYPKTSGKTGIHVLVPWARTGDDDEARAWAMEIAERVVGRLPDLATVQRVRSERGEKLYLDVMQNVRGHHVVPPYVLRAVPDAAVSTPLRWDELTSSLDRGAYTLKTIFRRLGHLKDDPMTGLLKSFR